VLPENTIGALVTVSHIDENAISISELLFHPKERTEIESVNNAFPSFETISPAIEREKTTLRESHT